MPPSHATGLSDDDVAELYDVLSPWDEERNRSDAFYHALVMDTRDVLDVGCGTGIMLHHAREAGHAGRLVGLDPDPAMLDRARRRDDIAWVLARAADATWDGEFDLAIMASHAFQVLVDDDDLARSLAAIRAALRPGGVFAFETRHPQARAWETWPSQPTQVTSPSGRDLVVSYEIESVRGDVVTLDEVYSDPDGTVVRADRGHLRFLDVDVLNRFLDEAGFIIDVQYGDWDRTAITGASEEIITLARKA
jgi:SAM-dependent methyltransferase